MQGFGKEKAAKCDTLSDINYAFEKCDKNEWHFSGYLMLFEKGMSFLIKAGKVCFQLNRDVSHSTQQRGIL